MRALRRMNANMLAIKIDDEIGLFNTCEEHRMKAADWIFTELQIAQKRGDVLARIKTR